MKRLLTKPLAVSKRRRGELFDATLVLRRSSLRTLVHLQRSSLPLAQRRVFLAQRRAAVYRTKRALKRRMRRVRPKTRFRYFGVFGKRRRRVERRDRLQLMRFVAASRRRAALRCKARRFSMRRVVTALRVQRPFVSVSTQLLCPRGAVTAVRRARLIRATTARREARAGQRQQLEYSLAATAAITRPFRKRKATISAAPSKRNAPASFTAKHQELPRAKKSRKGFMRAPLKALSHPLPHPFRNRFRVTSGGALPFQRTLQRRKPLFVGRAPAQARLSVLSSRGARKR